VTRLRRALPHPMLSAAIVLLWLALAPGFDLGTLLVGALVGVAIPVLTQSFWPDRPQLGRPLAAVRLFARVLVDIVVASWQVARLVLGPTARLRPAFLRVPIDIDDAFVATILGSIVSLTPGSVSVEIERERRSLLIHALDVDDESALIERIKTRYEAPLKEVFRC
jgi:multicomponent K+:H+ antiporter subunit E